MSFDEKGHITQLNLPDDFEHRFSAGRWREQRIVDGRLNHLHQAIGTWTHPLGGRTYRRMNAERNILPEIPNVALELSPEGAGATNIIRRYLNSTAIDRDLVRVELLDALNGVFGSDGSFTEIDAKEHDEQGNLWEIYLGEKDKGLVPLSLSGSGLKTIILVILNLIVIPKIYNQPKERLVFAFEELENNLHPALQRRLLRYIEEYAIREKAVFFLTTHSSVALDAFGVSSNSQIIHVTHNRVSASAKPITAHLDKLGVISELGAKPSDLLQANGVIWVEGPSDRIYINTWVEIFSGGRFKEGRDFQCAFYGGSLLSQVQVASADAEVSELVNLFRLNPSIAVVCDSDRTAADGEGSALKPRVARIKDEIEKLPNAHIWITDGKEIESYLTGSILGNVCGLGEVRDPGQYERFFASESASSDEDSFVETVLMRKTIDKVKLANEALQYMAKEKESIKTRFGLLGQVTRLISHVEDWNK